MMKRIILQLMSELSTLTAPFNPVDIKKIFAKHPPLDKTQLPPELTQHAEELLALMDLTEQSFNLANQRHGLSEEQDRLIHLTEDGGLTQQNIHKLQQQMHEKMELVSNSFQQLLPQINESLLKQNKLIPPYSATVDSKTQRLAVEEYNSQLSQSLSEMDAQAAALTLCQLTETRNSLIEELKTLGFNLSAKGGKDNIQKLISSITLSISQLESIKPKAIELHQLFAKQISIIDVQTKIKELELQTASIIEQLESTSLEISINTLDLKVKKRLSEEFKNSTNKSELIQTYHHKLPGALSYIDPYAWKSWIQDQHKYEVGQLETQNSVSYLQLLEKEHTLILSKTRLDEQKKTLNLLTPMAPSSCEEELEISKLVEQAQILLKACALLTTPITTPSGSSASDFYLALLSYIPVIEQKLELMAIVLVKLQKLDSLDIKILQLMAQYKLEEKNDHSANRKDLEELTKLIETPQTAKDVLIQQFELCKSFLTNAAELEEIKKQLQAAIIHKKNIELTLSVSHLGVPIPDQLHTISEQLSVLLLAISGSIEKINNLPLLNEKPEEPQTSSLEEEHHVTSSLVTPHVQVSLNLDTLPIPSQDDITEQQPSFSENGDHKQSTSAVSASLNQAPSVLHLDEEPTKAIMSPEKESSTPILSFATQLLEEQSISPPLSGLDLKPEQLTCDIPTSTIEPSPEQIFSASLPTEETSEEQLDTVGQGLNHEQPSMNRETSLVDQTMTSDEILLAAEQTLSPVQAQDELLASPRSIDLNASLGHIQEKIEEQLPIPNTIILESIEPPLTERVSEGQFVSTSPVALQSEQPTIPMLDSPATPLISTDTGGLVPKQPLLPKPISPVEQLTDEAMIATSRQTLASEEVEQKIPIKQLMSSDKIVSLLQQPLSAKEVHDEPLVSIAPVLKSKQAPPLIKDSPEEQLSSLPPHSQREKVEPLESADDMTLTLAMPSPTISNESQQRQNWYQQSLISLKYHPIDIQQWCMNVFNAVEKYTKEDDSYKASHLIRDISFELRFKKDLDVIKSYMRRCPVPEKDLNQLLALKPALPLSDEPFNDATDLLDVPLALRPLYEQCMRLKKEHPIEGELLLQALHSLRMAKILIDTPHSNISVTQVPFLSVDPRYEPLKRHRGFFKVWEAIEDFFRMLIGKIMGQAEFEYTKRPCFFRTKSARMIEEADLLIQKDLLPICAT
ncbi:hypothetical protein [Legionella maioricensis]|uniref:Interaptin n=1 Tax=Legionella maioricensis TaxID=2896528 RepID=A0A9X2CZS6_9GAMM|nr:hypothetical protein [Legionella maioricensis]MCL9683803.1 hypothetical protein [Legionella maioricensis]MCL9686650.1 hypothetical protein [Legionella maioricensis]